MRTRKNEYSENSVDDTVQQIQNNKIKIFLYNVADQVYIFIGFSFGVYLLWICLHYIASHLYVRMCVPSTVLGFLLSPFMTATPHCQGLRWVVFNAANMINNMWIILGAWIMSNVLVVTRDTTTS